MSEACPVCGVASQFNVGEFVAGMVMFLASNGVAPHEVREAMRSLADNGELWRMLPTLIPSMQQAASAMAATVQAEVQEQEARERGRKGVA